ncbi:MAG: polysaccharide biosynthesis C-terminal domain-containing protein [Gemmatimonadota bacterium]
MSFLRGFSSNLLGTGLVQVLGLANIALIARGLGQEGRGYLSLLATSVLLGSLVLGEWLNRGNTYVAGKEGRTGALVGNTLAFGVGVAAVSALAAEAAWRLELAPFLARPGYLLVAGIFAATLAQKAAHAIVLGEDRLHLYAALPVLFIGCYLAGTALALRVWSAGLDGVLAAWLVAAAVSLAATWAALGGGLRPRPRWDRGTLARTAVVGQRGGASATLVFLLFRVDVYLVGYLLGAAPLGVYAIALQLAEMMQRLPNVAGVVLLPKVLGGGDEEHGLSLQVARNVLLFSVAAALVVVTVGRPVIVWVFSAEFAGAHTPLMWMLPGLVASGIGSIYNTKLAGEAYPPVTIWAPAAALAVKVALCAALIPALGLTGAALATSAAYLVWAGTVTARYRATAGVTWGELLRGRTAEGRLAGAGAPARRPENVP